MDPSGRQPRHHREAERTTIAILQHIAENGELMESRPLSVHARSARFWPSKLIPRRAMRDLATTLQQQGVCSYRYTWYMVRWLIRSGWLDEVERERGRRAKAYAFSDRILRYHAHAVSCIPKLWEQGAKAKRTSKPKSARVASGKWRLFFHSSYPRTRAPLFMGLQEP